jgi:hypothetical protein
MLTKDSKPKSGKINFYSFSCQGNLWRARSTGKSSTCFCWLVEFPAGVSLLSWISPLSWEWYFQEKRRAENLNWVYSFFTFIS